jgi:hypothetical protein
MKNITISILVFMGVLQQGFSQTNLFTPGNNGGFETPESINDFSYNPTTPWSISRSSTYAFAGSYSMRCVPPSTAPSSKILESISFGSISDPTGQYYIRARVYIPSTSTLSPNTNIVIMIRSVDGFCTANMPVVRSDWYNQWLPSYRAIPAGLLSGALKLDVYVTNCTTAGEFYIDGIELVRAGPIMSNSVVDFTNRNITLEATGGITGIPYTYEWDDGPTTKDRTGLPYGKYRVRITQVGVPSCLNAFEFVFPPPAPAIDNPLPSQCQVPAGTTTGTTTLTASGIPGVSFRWSNGVNTELGTSSQLVVGPFEVPGTYRFYAEAIINQAKSLKTETVITVHPTPSPSLAPNSNTAYLGKPVVFTAATHQTGYQYNYTIQDGSTQVFNTTANTLSYTFQNLGMHDVTVVTSSNGCTLTSDFDINVVQVIPLCTTVMPLNQANNLALDKFAGQVIFKPTSACAENIPLGCIGGKVDAPLLTNVVSASAVTFSGKWDYGYMGTSPSGSTAVDRAEVGKWRSHKSYAFSKTGVKFDRNYNSGTYQLAHFNWKYPEASARMGWIKANETIKYSPHGQAVEEVNTLNMFSAAKFGYGGAVPYLIAKNSDYNSALFESFESVYGTAFEEGVPNANQRTSSIQHSGEYSYDLISYFDSRPFRKSLLMETRGMFVRFWATGAVSPTAFTLEIRKGPGAIASQGFTRVATSGQWSLWEARIAPGMIVANDNESFTVRVARNAGVLGGIFIDDIRIQPMESEMTCYVYDPKTLRLLAVMDDQHFGLFYQYNYEGKLIRKLIETEKGLQTLQETQYNTPKVNRPQ